MGTTTKTKKVQELEPRLAGVLDDLVIPTMTDIYNTDFTKYDGEVVVGETAEEKAIREQLMNLGSMDDVYSTGANIALDIANETPEERQARVLAAANTYTSGVANPMLERAEFFRQQQRLKEQDAVSATPSAFQNVRGGLQQAATEAQYKVQQDEMLADLYQRGLDYGTSFVDTQDANRAAGAAQYVDTLAAGRDADVARLTNNLSLAGIPRSFQQAQADFDLSEFMRSVGYDANKLASLVGGAAAIPSIAGGTANETTTTSGLGPAMKGVGGLMSAAGSFGMGGGFGGLMGTGGMRPYSFGGPVFGAGRVNASSGFSPQYRNLNYSMGY